MSELIALEDCDLSVEKYREVGSLQPDELKILLTLPRHIALRGIEIQRTFEPWGHDIYPNNEGTLYIACDNHARFWPREEDEDQLSYMSRFRSGRFVSTRSWSYLDEGDSFEIRRCRSLFYGLEGKIDKPKIIDGIRSDEELTHFLNRFFGWIGGFVAQYGDNHFYDPEERPDLRPF